MPTVLRSGSLRVVIYTDDDPPPHVHIFGDGETKIALPEAGGAPMVVRVVGGSLRESRRALRIVRENSAFFTGTMERDSWVS
ncbi:DUF4160 domain-containing protein [Sphingomonas sp. DT-207]|uniref:DUF4160 domain-containing protein n=1 Tax=Sphingomonas sp. DT-207 TaxID=3396167 RepID=UPI003F199B4D